MTLVDNNAKTVKAMFDGRMQYKTCTYPKNAAQPMDLREANAHYGFVDNLGNAIYPNEAFFKQVQSTQGIYLAIDFVAEAFNAFVEKYTLALRQGVGVVREPKRTALLDIGAVAAWTSVHKDYDSFVKSVFSSFSANYGKFDKAIQPDVILKDFRVFLRRTAGALPFTFNAYLSSKFPDVRCCGLMIEIQKAKHGDDKQKEQLLSDPNFAMYSEIAVKCGFAVDKNAPWRLIADINSPAMKQYLDKYELTPSSVFSLSAGRFLLGDDISLDLFRRYVLAFCRTLAGESISDPLSDLEWMELYVFTRDIEKQSSSLDSRAKLVYDANVLYQKFGSRAASLFIENAL